MSTGLNKNTKLQLVTSEESYLSKKNNNEPEFHFHILKDARDIYNFASEMFSQNGDIIFANLDESKKFTDIVNKKRNAAENPDVALQASTVNALGLLEEIMHYVIENYRKQNNPKMFDNMEEFLIQQFGEDRFDDLLLEFASAFPISSVYTNKELPANYIKGQTGGLPNKHVILEEMIVLWLDNMNPVYKPLDEFIDDNHLETNTIYNNVFDKLNIFFEGEPAVGEGAMGLLDFLLEPSRKFPHSIMAQLEYIRLNWGFLIGDFISRLVLGLDFMKEEQKNRSGFVSGGEIHVPDFTGEEYDPERFTMDKEWMPRLVLLAKSTYVWLDQLSKTYNREIITLADIPDSELDRLRDFGFTGLWLIGLWERSKSSEKIKKINGNPEAVASAYSLYDYSIAEELGGEEAYQSLARRCWERGIRLASDMVPNHMGIDSRWVIEHPDWFVQRDTPPFPSHTFNGTDLSDDPRVGIFIEDGYWNQSDAAGAFKRVDRNSGDVRYIYHGNDGTTMPWNDTAQLNYLIPEVREAVIQTILHVARKFPIIRFDAAMTLAKKHYQRLWYPEPGSGGDIPSRSEYAMTKAEFNRVFPEEFWREVVDRIQTELPDTLLLAEAFWMMESYFVRTLGMHRVYNSAFMHMLKNEDNAKYRYLIKNVLEFNPQILQRYVNFMNNPDEDTAVEQFGKDDKYFGCCVTMSTLPGLPMFGHGQIEGFAEKYGMEYKKSYWDEKVDQWLVDRHKREIVPILKRRHLFSSSENFLLYDVFNNDHVNENVFAYSNASGDDKSLVFYNNKFTDAEGWINMSAGFNKADCGIIQKSLQEGLGLTNDSSKYLIFKDIISGNEFIRSSKDLCDNGFYIKLGAFKYHVFIEFREVHHTADRPYGDLCGSLNGGGVKSIEESMDEFMASSVIHAFQEAINTGSITYLSRGWNGTAVDQEVLHQFVDKLYGFTNAVSIFMDLNRIEESDMESIIDCFGNILNLSSYIDQNNYLKIETIEFFREKLSFPPTDSLDNWRILMILPFLKTIGMFNKGKSSDDIFKKCFIEKYIVNNLKEFDIDYNVAVDEARLIKALISFGDGMFIETEKLAAAYFENLFSCEDVKLYCDVNVYEDKIYFNAEQFEDFLYWLFVVTSITLMASSTKKNYATKLNKAYKNIQKYTKLAKKAGYEYDMFIQLLTK